MKNLLIDWKHFDKDGKTCERCSNTGHNLKQVISEMQSDFQGKGIDIKVKETKLTEKDMGISNSLLINGVAIENILDDLSVIKNECDTCGDLAGNPCCCRAIKSDDVIHEDIPKETIKQAILKILGL